MTVRTFIATVTLAALPLFAFAATQHQNQHHVQTAVVQNSGSGMNHNGTMGQGMMKIIAQVRNDLAALANENDPAVLHKRIAKDGELLGQFTSHMQSMQGMSGTMMSGGMMSHGMMNGNAASSHMSNCPGAANQPQK